MIKNIDELKSKINTIREQLSSFSTDERKEIKKNNKIIADYKEELFPVRDIMFDVIKERKEQIIPINKDDLLIENNLKLDELFKKVKFLSDNSFVTKLGIDKNLYEIKYSGSLDKVNINILELINKFLLIDVKLSSDDFKYSLSVYKYMNFFLENNNNDEFDKLIANLFDSLYWECPDIVLHIYLSFMLLIDNYKDKFENYIKKENGNNDYNEFLSNYYDEKKKIIDKSTSDEYLIYNKFLNGELRIEDYLDDSIMKKEVISKYIDYDVYVKYSDENKNYFYEQINGMYLDLCEYLNLSKYNFLIEKVKNIYSNKNSYINNYSSMKKNIKNLDKQRGMLNSKLFNIYNKLNGRTRGMLFRKYNSLFNKVNNKIMEIIDVYNNYDEVCFINDVVVKLNDDSTYYDVLKIYENNYNYLIKLLKDNDCQYEDFIEFLYNPYLNISMSIPFVNSIDIKTKLVDKYDFYDINLNLSDDNKLKDELKYIIRLWCFERESIDLNKFKLIFDIDKLKNEEI